MTKARWGIGIGIDIGSTTAKVVIIDESGTAVHRSVEPTEPRIRDQAARLIARASAAARSPLAIVATGYGRKLVEGARAVTEVTCHARGAFHLFRRPGLLIDMGGQDTKAIRIDERGAVADFAMNDKCAAGTGRFLEVILARLQAPWRGLRETYEHAPRTVRVSSTCTVFAESEVISLIANGEDLDGIVRGVHDALAERVAALAGRLSSGVDEILLSGGVANDEAMAVALQHAFGKPVRIVPDPQIVGALGAALVAAGFAEPTRH